MVFLFLWLSSQICAGKVAILFPRMAKPDLAVLPSSGATADANMALDRPTWQSTGAGYSPQESAASASAG